MIEFLNFLPGFLVIQYKDRFIPRWKNIPYWIWSSQKGKRDKLLTEFFWDTSQ